MNEQRLKSSSNQEQQQKLDSKSAETLNNSEEKKERLNVTRKQVDTDVGAKQAVPKISPPEYKKVDSKPVVDTLNKIILRIYDESGDETSFYIRTNQKLKK